MSIGKIVTRVVATLTSLAFLAIAAFVVFVVILRWDNYKVQLSLIEVPEYLAQRGLTDVVVTRRMVAEIDHRNNVANRNFLNFKSDDVQSNTQYNTQIKLGNDSSWASLSKAILNEDIQIPGAGLTVGTAIRFLRQSVGIDDLVIQGEITSWTNGDSENCGPEQVGQCLWLHLRAKKHLMISVSAGPYRYSEFDQLIEEGVERLMLKIDPSISVLYSLEKGDSKEAIEKASDMINDRDEKIYPGYEDDPMAYEMLSQILFLEGKTDEALREIDNAIFADPSYSDAYLLKADILFKVGEFERAKETYEYMVANFDDMTEPRNRIGLIHIQQGDYELAIDQFRIIAKEDPYYLYPQINWGLSLEKTNDPQGAIGRYHDIIEIARREPDAVVDRNSKHKTLLAIANMNWGFVLMDKMQDYEGAIEKFKRAAVYDNDNPMILNNWAYAHFLNGSLEEAMIKVDEALKKDSKHPLSNETKAEIFEQQGELEQALAYFEKAVLYGGASMKFSQSKVDLLKKKIE